METKTIFPEEVKLLTKAILFILARPEKRGILEQYTKVLIDIETGQVIFREGEEIIFKYKGGIKP